MTDTGRCVRRTFLALVGVLQLAVPVHADELPTPDPIEEAARARFAQVWDLVASQRLDKARRAVQQQLDGIDRLSAYEQACLYLTLAWIDQVESKPDEASGNFGKGLGLGEAPADLPGILSTRGLLIQLYEDELASRERRELEELLKRRLELELPRLRPWIPFEPDHWPDGFPREPPQDI